MNLGEAYKEYQRTVFGREVLTVPGAGGIAGFCTYEVADRGVYIADIYVAPAARKLGIGRELLKQVEEIARRLKLPYVFGTVDVTTKTWKASVAAQKACGFKEAVINGPVMVLVKEVEP